MNLYDSPNAKTIQAANGKCLPAIDVYAMTLKYLKDTALEWMDKMFKYPGRSIQWIVTVPAIWSDAAKEIMRKAAEKVELPKESMVFAYEPEAAAMFSRRDFLRDEKSFSELSYLVVDCGGGTVDIAAHKMTKQHGNIYIEELSHPEGGNCAGFAVNDQFEKMINNIINVPVAQFHQLKINCSVQWAKLINDGFEAAKPLLDPDDASTPFTLVLHKNICNEIEKITGKSMEQLVKNYYNRNIEWDDDERAIVLHYRAMYNIFKPVLNDICSLITRVLAKPSCKQVNTILLVGGFAESALLFKTIKESFPSINVCRSSHPTYSVVKGAVLCGQHENLVKAVIVERVRLTSNPLPPIKPIQNKHFLPGASSQFNGAQIVTDTLPSLSISEETSQKIKKFLPPAVTKNLPIVVSRKMRYSIGVEIVEPFKVKCHDPNRRIIQNGETYCARVFYPLVAANENISIDSPKRSYNFRPLTDEQSHCTITIFASESEKVKYIDDRGCHNRAKVDIHNLPLYRTHLSREIELCINFYNTELEITASCISSRETKKVKVSYEFFPTA
ncbi:heat shock 70 kDa protein 12A-like isoform X2 [Dysidea avara]